ncbi:T9SS type A sorting domain-containing protein [bacterium]|nr:T9SS type A sorting domain-containing protein [bacterium]
MKKIFLLILIISIFFPILVFAYITNQHAETVIGQTDMTTNTLYDPPTASSLRSQGGVWFDGSKLFIADSANHRVLIYNSFPESNNVAADVVIGQPNMTSREINQGGSVGANTLYLPRGVYSDGTKLIIADSLNHRVLIYNNIPTNYNASADVVVGQQNFTSNASNQGGTTASNTLAHPHTIFISGAKLIISDCNNHRVLIYNTTPSSNNADANIVIGQLNMTSYFPNPSGVQANSLFSPTGIASDGNRFFVADTLNHRALIFNSIPTSNGVSANIVIGQPNMTSRAANQGGDPAANVLNTPVGISYADLRLFISEQQNHRILIYNSVPINHNENADVVIGQPDFTSRVHYNGGIQAYTLGNPNGIYCDDKRLVIADYFYRVLIHYPFPEINAIEPKHSIGGRQITMDIIGTSFTDVVLNQGMTIKLKRNSSEITASNLNNQRRQLLACVFDITGFLPGVYDLQLEVYGKISRLLKRFFILDQVATPSKWDIIDMGQMQAPALAGIFYDISIGDADNDGFQEVMVANRNSKLFSFNKFISSWSITELPEGASGEYYSGVVIYDGDHDEEIEVYGSTLDNYVYQYTGPGWNKELVGANEDKIYDLAFGDGNNDGEIEIYAACANGHVFQFKKNTTWQRTDIGDMGAQVYSVTVGDGNSDGEFEVYAACSDNKIYQCKYNGAGWDISIIGSGSGEMYAVVVGDGNLDSQQEVYGANQDGKIYQFKWQVSSWANTEVGFGTDEMHGMDLSDGDNNGRDSLYAACLDGHVYQFRSEDGQWLKKDLGSAETPLYSLAVGDGDNDNQFEVYAVGENNRVYQFKAKILIPTPTITATVTATPIASMTFSPTVTITPLSNFAGRIISKNHIYAAPNPVRGHIANIVIFTNQPAEVSGKLFATSNQEVLSFRRYYGKGKNIERINISNLANGVYLLLIKAKGSDGTEERVIKKIAIVK